jgi:hypothetical protein
MDAEDLVILIILSGQGIRERSVQVGGCGGITDEMNSFHIYRSQPHAAEMWRLAENHAQHKIDIHASQLKNHKDSLLSHLKQKDGKKV